MQVFTTKITKSTKKLGDRTFVVFVLFVVNTISRPVPMSRGRRLAKADKRPRAAGWTFLVGRRTLPA